MVIRLNSHLFVRLVCFEAKPVGGGNVPPSCRPQKIEEENTEVSNSIMEMHDCSSKTSL